MPKGNPQFQKRLDFYAPPETRAQVIAVSFQIGHKHKYAAAARKLLLMGLDYYKATLTPKQLNEFNAILEQTRVLEKEK